MAPAPFCPSTAHRTPPHLDVAARVEAVQLVDDLQHGALHLVVAARAVVEARTADGVHLVEEHDAGLVKRAGGWVGRGSEAVGRESACGVTVRKLDGETLCVFWVKCWCFHGPAQPCPASTHLQAHPSQQSPLRYTTRARAHTRTDDACAVSTLLLLIFTHGTTHFLDTRDTHTRHTHIHTYIHTHTHLQAPAHLLGPGHLEQLAHHARALAHVLLDQL